MTKESVFNMLNNENIYMDLSRKELAKLVFPEVKFTIDGLEKKYPNANKEFACSIRVEKVCGVHWIIYDAFHVTVHLIYMTTL